MSQPQDISASARSAISSVWSTQWIRGFRRLWSPPLPALVEPPSVSVARFENSRSGRFLWNPWLTKVTVALLLLISVFLIRYRLIWVVGNSMRPTYRTGDLLVVDKFAYRSSPPRRGDIVLARYQREWIVKRVMGLPGERIEVRRGHVEIDGVRPVTQFAVEPGWLDIAPGNLMEDRYAILGDNRSVDASSFIHAVVSSAQIAGKVVFAVTR